ncbi:hypothetical protein LCGC14_2347290 [marine sediment metagenome]|uniref:Uncharacterized protein n=1 Tax=marine sediment metagenome TaxID=412755 RepID=A0A0F9F5E7_9ZZZZ
MKTSQALYEAIEGVKSLETAMVKDYNDPDTKPAGCLWIQERHHRVLEKRLVFEHMRDSLNEVE